MKYLLILLLPIISNAKKPDCYSLYKRTKYSYIQLYLDYRNRNFPGRTEPALVEGFPVKDLSVCEFSGLRGHK